MYERFTDRARKVMQLAAKEAQRLNHEYISTGHVLLGAIQEGSGVAANVLKNLEIDLVKVRNQVNQLLKSGPELLSQGKMPHTPRTKKVIEWAFEEANQLKHNYVGTEHLLLGLLHVPEGVAGQVLVNLGAELSVVRQEILNLLGVQLEPTDQPIVMEPSYIGIVCDQPIPTEPGWYFMEMLNQTETYDNSPAMDAYWVFRYEGSLLFQAIGQPKGDLPTVWMTKAKWSKRLKLAK